MLESGRNGCIVVVERGARWPGPVFERLTDRAGVVLVTWLPDEPLLCFLTRLAHGCTLLERSGILIRSAVLACSGERGVDQKARSMVVRSIANRLAPVGESSVTIVGDGAEGSTPADLVALAEPLVLAKNAAPVRIEVTSQDALAKRMPAVRQAGSARIGERSAFGAPVTLSASA
jgi:hypothetical protein